MAKCKTPAQADAEPIEDMVPVVLWVQNGARPPIPSLSWRILHHLRSRPRTSPQPATNPEPPGHPGCFFMRGVAS